MLAAAGLALMLAAVAISHYQILCHLRNYTEPLFQVRERERGRARARDRALRAPLPTSAYAA